MDTLLDEKLVLSCARVCTEYFKKTLYVSAEKEAYGPSRNQGLCYESVSAIRMEGDFNGCLYMGMDGYTKMKLLPRIAENYQIDPAMKGMSRSVLLEFSNQMAAALVEEIVDGGYNLQIQTPDDLSNQLVPIDLKTNRQYILIFFLRDRRLRRYLGRLYLILVLEKYKNISSPASKKQDAQPAADS